jgi:thioredoxin 1
MFFKIFNRRNQSKDNKSINQEKNNLPDHVIILNKNSINDFIEKYPICIIDFWAPWCSPCKTMLPRFRRLAVIYKNKIAFGRFNIQSDSKILKKYNVMSVPFLLFFKNGKQVFSSSGKKSIGDLKEIINEKMIKI